MDTLTSLLRYLIVTRLRMRRIATTVTCDQALFSFRLVNPFLRKRETKFILASDPVKVNKSDAKIRPDRRL